MMFEYAEEVERLADIKVTGVGGAGGNAVGRMIAAGLSGVEFLAVNTDLQALQDSPAHQAMQIGAQLTKGLGSGGDPKRGCAAAEEDREHIAAALAGADMVFVTAGMGGGTGTGAAPVIADIARNQGALTVGIVTKPFQFEGTVRMRQAEEGIERLRDAVDTLIIIPNQRLLEVVPPSTSMQEAFRIADNVLYDATRGIYEIISRHDHVNLDFADVRSVMKGMGEAMMGTGRAEGENRAVDAARAAINSPLLEDVNIAGSQAVLVNVLGREVGLQDTAAAMQYIQEAAGPEAHVIFGYGNDEAMGDTLQVTVIATGFQAGERTMGGTFASSLIEDPEGLIDEVVAITEGGETDAESALPADSAAEDPAEPDPSEAQSAADAAEVAAMPAAEAPAPTRPTTVSSATATAAPMPITFVDEIPGAMASTVEDSDPALASPTEVGQASAASLGARPAVVGADELMPPQARAGATIPPHDTTLPEADVSADPAADPADHFMERFAQSGEGAQGAFSSAPSHPFLRRIGVRPLGEVEVPAVQDAPTSVTRSVASGLGPEKPGDDISAPAYTRKYMD